MTSTPNGQPRSTVDHVNSKTQVPIIKTNHKSHFIFLHTTLHLCSDTGHTSSFPSIAQSLIQRKSEEENERSQQCMQHRRVQPLLSVKVELTSAHFPNDTYLTGPALQGLQEAQRHSLSHTLSISPFLCGESMMSA